MTQPDNRKIMHHAAKLKAELNRTKARLDYISSLCDQADAALGDGANKLLFQILSEIKCTAIGEDLPTLERE